MEEFKNEGIYALINTITNDMYIGSSTNLGSRKDKHFSLLKHQKHGNERLQFDVNKYGIENFKFNVIEFRTETLKEQEQYYINAFNPTYNITIEVIRNTPSESSRQKMSVTRLKLYKENKLIPNGRKRIVGINVQTGEIKTYESIREARTINDIDRSAMQKTLRGIYSQMKGFKWYYETDYLDLLKLDKLLENPEEDNQQLTTNLKD